MSYLVTGSSGKTSSRLAHLLHAAGKDFVVASRSGAAPAPYKGVAFDWLDEATWPRVFAAAPRLAGVWIVAPPSDSSDVPVKRFIDEALARGVRRFVLLSATVLPPGGPLMGQVHTYLMELAKTKGVEWAVLRPTWFMENFSEAVQLGSIREKGAVQSAAGDGIVPFISAKDIAAVAYHALVDAKPHNTDHILVGPQRLTYEDVATKLTKALGRTIKYKRNTLEEQTEFYASFGVPASFAPVLAGADVGIEKGSEDIQNDVIETVTGRPATTFDAFVQESKEAWSTK